MCGGISSKVVSNQSDDELREEIATLDHIEARVKARRLAVIAEIDRRGSYREDGARDMAAWLIGQSVVSPQTANELVEVARTADELPAIAEALDSGELSWEVAKEVAKIAEPANVEALVDSAINWSASEARGHVRRSKEISKAEQRQVETSRSLRVWWNPEKTMLVINGQLSADGGATLDLALSRVMDGLPNKLGGAFLPADQRRADALVELASAHLAGDRDKDRATVAVHVDYETLVTGRGVADVGEGIGSPDVARMMGCDSRIQIVLDSLDGTPVGIGRADRNVPPYLRRAVLHRDKHCIFPGCEQTRGLICHHSDWWVRDLGQTDEENLAALCPSHHRLPHVLGWTMTGSARVGWVFQSPTGRRFDVAPKKAKPLGGRHGDKGKRAARGRQRVCAKRE